MLVRNSMVRAALVSIALWGLACSSVARAAEEPITEAASQEVGQWQFFEGRVDRADLPADPYRDVTLETRFTRPDGTVISFWGFFDGGQTWRFRVLAEQTGTWRYDAKFSDGKPGAQGTFTCIESELPGRIAVDPTNPMWFGYASGNHGILRGLHIGDRFFAANWPEEQRTAFLDWCQKRRYNLLSIASHLLNRDAPGRGQGWDTPKLWPPDAAEYRRMEAILDDLAKRRIIVFPFAGFFGQSSNYPRDPKDQEVYLQYTLARLAPRWNMLWNVAGPEPNVGKGWMKPEEVERLGRSIARLDPFRHPISVHNRTGDDPYINSDWSTYGVLQGPKTFDLAVLSRGLLKNHHPTKPLLAQETLWSGNSIHIKRNGSDYSDDQLRKNAWVIQMSATALVFADNDGNSSTGFSGTLDLADAREERHAIVGCVWNFMETVPFYRMKPRQDLVDRGFCLAEEGREYLVYLPEGGAVQVAAPENEYRVQWINARDTSEVQSVGTTSSGQALTAPDASDWLLRLTATKEPRVGAVAPRVAPSQESDTTVDSQASSKQPAVGLSVGAGAYPDLSVGADGSVGVVYARDEKLFFRLFEPKGRGLGPEEDTGVPAGNAARSDPEVVLRDGVTHVFSGATYGFSNGDGWQVLKPNVVRDTALAVDSKGNVFIVRRGGREGGLVGLKKLTVGAKEFRSMPDPDIAGGLPKGKGSDHCYGHLVAGPDDALHLVYRHGAPQEICYRTSTDGGQTWQGCGVSDDRAEAPSGAVGADGKVYLITGRGHVYRRAAGEQVRFEEIGKALDSGPRDLPALAVDEQGTLYAASFGGRYNVYRDGRWLGQRRLSSVTGKKIGFVELAAATDRCYVVWEEGDEVNKDLPAGTSQIFLAELSPEGELRKP
ncbi:MAG: DUF5060 domain-containing protein [Planctomycetota bacterium]